MKRLRKILLVDDDRITNLMHTRLIDRTGLAEEVEIETDGQAALEHLEHAQANGGVLPDLILLDINMPRMDGFEFLEAYAALPAQMTEGRKILMLSTSTLDDDRRRAEADPNVTGFMAKPLSTERLLSFLRAPGPAGQAG